MLVRFISPLGIDIAMKDQLVRTYLTVLLVIQIKLFCYLSVCLCVSKPIILAEQFQVNTFKQPKPTTSKQSHHLLELLAKQEIQLHRGSIYSTEKMTLRKPGNRVSLRHESVHTFMSKE